MPQARTDDIEVILEDGRDTVCQRPGTLRFRVQVADTGEPITGLKPRLRYHRAADDFTLERRNFTEVGEGAYTVPFKPSVIGAHALLFGAAYDGFEITEIFALDAAPTQATVQAEGATYRIGAEWKPNHIHSHDDHRVKLVFQIDRLEPGGPHPVGAKDVEVQVTCAERGVRDTLPATVTGPGAYEVERPFTIAEVGPKDMQYDIALSFRDPSNGAQVQPGSVVFPLTAGPAH